MHASNTDPAATAPANAALSHSGRATGPAAAVLAVVLDGGVSRLVISSSVEEPWACSVDPRRVPAGDMTGK
jgi:hypothetical protein